MIDYHAMRRFNGTRRHTDDMVATICQECPVGCGQVAYLSEGRLVDVQGDERNPVSKGRLCARGTAFARDVYSPIRITRPASRKSLHDDFGELESWEHSLDLLADRLKKIRDQHGPHSLVIDCGPSALDFTTSVMRFAALWGTPHIFSPFAQPGRSSSGSAVIAPDSVCVDWIHSRCLFFVGADPASTHPVAFRWALEAQKEGAKIVVADTRFTRTMSKADLALRIRPDTGNLLGTALMKVILDEELFEPEAVQTRFTDAESWQDTFERMSVEAAVESIGLSPAKFRQAAFLLAKRGPAQLVTGKSLAHLVGHGIWRTIAAALGQTEKNGCGWYPLDSGTPTLAYMSGLQEETSPQIAESLQAGPMGSLNALLRKITEGNMETPKAVICCSNGLADLCEHLTRGGGTEPLIVYFGCLPNETSGLAHMLLPAQSWAERDSLIFTNDKAIQWGRKIVDPPADARTGLDFWLGLARRFGWEDRFPWTDAQGDADHEGFYNWLLDQSPSTKGCTVEIVKDATARNELVLWPFQPESLNHGASGKIVPTSAATPEGSAHTSDDLYPLHFECSDAVFTTTIGAECGPMQGDSVVQINPETGRALGIATGDQVVVDGPIRCIQARAWITRAVPRWLVYLQRGPQQKRVLLRKKGQSSHEALNILRELLS